MFVDFSFDLLYLRFELLDLFAFFIQLFDEERDYFDDRVRWLARRALLTHYNAPPRAEPCSQDSTHPFLNLHNLGRKRD